MKKIYTIKSLAVAALALMANVAMGQNLKVTSHGNPVKDGDVIDLPYELVVDEYPEYDITFYTAKWDPHFEAATVEGTAPLTVTLSSVDNPDDFQLCWPENCVPRDPGATVSASGSIKATPQEISIHITQELDSADQIPTAGGSAMIKFTSGGETVAVRVNALHVEASVGGNVADSAKPVYYTLQGVRVAEPQKGQIYIVRKAGKATKRIF